MGFLVSYLYMAGMFVTAIADEAIYMADPNDKTLAKDRLITRALFCIFWPILPPHVVAHEASLRVQTKKGEKSGMSYLIIAIVVLYLLGLSATGFLLAAEDRMKPDQSRNLASVITICMLWPVYIILGLGEVFIDNL